jgi:homoserine kinase
MPNSPTRRAFGVSGITSAAVSVRVPATSANLGPGFDALGLALRWYDDVILEVADRGVAVDVVGEGDAAVDRGEANLVVRAAVAAFDAMGARPSGLRLTCRNTIPHARGLGSSAAAIVAGASAGRALLSGGSTLLDDAALLRLCSELEGHPDNVAACLFGGLTIAFVVDGRPRATRLAVLPEIAPVIFVPTDTASTTQARGMLPDAVPHTYAAVNAGRAALLVAALTVDPRLLLAATEDRLHQPYRAPAMPETAELMAALRADGVPATVSGAGPSVLALSSPDEALDLTVRAPAGWAAHVVDIDNEGVRVGAQDASDIARGPMRVE